ncbi:MAG: hypothetical protein CFH32_00950 [Alphaproteobacteria bacterium MarineAlpha9_Bin2]|nr:MAG: hypothetical protein CFH31_00923 [Alphaproteobacteria bacterium MarineAlpha9_Bin1]PPR30054.1 MAG: hypothetical protein CFH32_00950 [Alphaproteobacteria bacterium MarineAlpha9_Bin2]
MKHVPGQVKFLVCVDESEECKTALQFACMRAKNTNGSVVLLYIIEPQDLMHFAGVENVMKTEAYEKANTILEELKKDVLTNFGFNVECKIDQGKKYDKIVDLVNKDETISILVLGAAPEGKGTNVLIQRFSIGLTASVHIPLTIVPGNLTNDELLKIT